MIETGREKITVLSLLPAAKADPLREHLANDGVLHVQYLDSEQQASVVRWLSEGSAEPGIAIDDVDVVLVDMADVDIHGLRQHCDSGKSLKETPAGRRTKEIPAIVGVFQDGPAPSADPEVLLAFDGIVTAPFQATGIRHELAAAIARAKRRAFWDDRYAKVRYLCRILNRRRRDLRKKVDLLCSDLVGSNIQLSSTLRELQQVYDFQSELIGEFDLHYLLGKSLRQLKEHLPGSNTAVYLSQTDSFEAHLSGAGMQDDFDIDRIETALYQTVVKPVCQRRLAYRRGEPVLSAVTAPVCQSDELSNCGLMGLPLIADQDLVGAVVFYRSGNRNYTKSEKKMVQNYLNPLARAIVALQNLENLIGPIHS